MEDHKATGLLTAKTHWPDYCEKIKDHPAYLAVASNTSGSLPKDLFEDVAEGMKKQYQEDKSNIEDAMKAGKLTVTSAWTLDKFKASIGEVYDLAATSETNLKLVFEEVLEQVKEKEEKEAKKREKLADDFTVLLYSVKEIVASSKWEDCIPFLKDAQAYRAISDESFRWEIFNEYIANLHEKVKEKKRKRAEEKVAHPHEDTPHDDTHPDESVVADIASIFQYGDMEMKRLRVSIRISDGVYKDTCTAILSSLERFSERLRTHAAYTPHIVSDIFQTLRAEISGDVSLEMVQRRVTKGIIKREVFPFYEGEAKLRAYQVTRCVDPQIACLIYPRFLAAYGRYPNNDQIPLYFAQQLFAEVRLGLNVNYLDIPGYFGQGRGRLADRDQYRKVNRVAPTHRQLVGQRFPVVTPSMAPIADKVLIASQRKAIDTIGDIASATTTITSNTLDKYILSRPRVRLSSEASFNAESDSELYRVAGLPTPQELRDLLRTGCQIDMLCSLLEDLLQTYSFIASSHHIPIQGVRDLIRASQPIVSPTQSTSGHTELSHHSVQHDLPMDHSTGAEEVVSVDRPHITPEQHRQGSSQIRHMDMLLHSNSTPLHSQMHNPLHSTVLERVRTRDGAHDLASMKDMMVADDPLAIDPQLSHDTPILGSECVHKRDSFDATPSSGQGPIPVHLSE